MNKKYLHILFWILLWVVISVLSSNGIYPLDDFKKFTPMMFLLIIVSYVNWLYLHPILFQRRKYLSYTISALLLIYLVNYLSHIALEYWLHWIFPEVRIISGEESVFKLPTSFWRIITGSAPYSIAFLASTIIKSSTINIQNQKTISELKIENEKQKLEYLQSQISPHFLFNSLNNIHSLIISDHPQSGEYVVRLSDLLRYMLYEVHKEKVSLKKEIYFLRAYIDLVNFKTGNPELTQNIIIQVENMGFSIPPLLLLTIIENGVKHSGLETQENAFLHLTITLISKTLHLEMKNNVSDSLNSRNRSGIGLKNVKSRLMLYYPQAHEFVFTLEDNIAMTSLKIKL